MILSFISITIFTNKKPRTAVQHTLFGANISIRGTTQIRFVLTQQNREHTVIDYAREAANRAFGDKEETES